jgi:hypothetical protein
MVVVVLELENPSAKWSMICTQEKQTGKAERKSTQETNRFMLGRGRSGAACT